MTTRISKDQVALMYLTDALALYRQGRYYSALTLGGAAEEVLGVIVRKMGEVNALECELADQMSFSTTFHKLDPLKFPVLALSKLRTEVLNARNSAKHFNDPGEPDCVFHPEIESARIILRALWNFRRLYPSKFSTFEESEFQLSIDLLNRSMAHGLALPWNG